MRTLLRFLAFTFLPVLTAGDFYAQTSKLWTISATHSIHCDTAGINFSSSVTLRNLYASLQFAMIVSDYGDGSSLDTFCGAAIPDIRTLTHRYNAPGRYIVRHLLTPLNCKSPLSSPSGPGSPPFSAFCDTSISVINVSCHPPAGGELFHDGNSNCSHDSTDRRINLSAYIQVDSAGVQIDTIAAMGIWRYYILADSPTIYTFRLLNDPTGYTLTCTATITYNYHPDSLATLDQHFGFQCSSTPMNDYSLSVFRVLRAATSGGPSYVGLYASNNSCHRDSGVVTLHISPKYNFSSSAIRPAPASVSGQTITWKHSNMADGVISQYIVPLSPLSTTANGDTACTYAVITPLSGDANPLNNIISICDSVRNSWDPNEKTVLPNGPVAAGTLLTYTIDFENKGNDTAFNIHVQDTLSEHLDAGTFQLLSATHSVTPYLYENAAAQRIIKFDFQDILLAGKDDSLHNKGQVRFSIKMKNDLPDGTVVANRAGIYFDGNDVVLTNTAYNNIPLPTVVANPKLDQGIIVYPNPVKDEIRIRVLQDDWSEAAVITTIGQIIRQATLSSGENSIRVADLPTGIYYLRLKGKTINHTFKVVKQ